MVDRWEKTVENPKLKQLIVILHGLGIEDAAITLQDTKFKHLLDTEKRKVPKAGTPRPESKVKEETEENFWKSIYKLPTAAGYNDYNNIIIYNNNNNDKPCTTNEQFLWHSFINLSGLNKDILLLKY